MQLMWFRRDLRVEDNTALQSALNTQQPVYAIYIATPTTWQQHDLSGIQADLIYRRLFELQNDLARLNVPLLYLEVETYQQSVDALLELSQTLQAERIVFNREYEVNELARDARLSDRAPIDVRGVDDKCLFPPGSVLNQQGQYFKVFTPFKRKYLARLETEPLVISKTQPAAAMPSHDIDDGSLPVFSVHSPFTYPRDSSQSYPVATRAIRQRLRDFCDETIDRYQLERDRPALDSTSQLSPYLAIGALSVRQCLARAQFGCTPPLNDGRETWVSELVWRDFYQHLLHFEPKLAKGHNFVVWTEKVRWPGSSAHLELWQQGKTGYPIVDAAMRQLNQTGWMHNRLRMVVASFLTKDLHVHWREGERYFMQQLVDGDYAANNGGWQWSASTGCDGQPYFRIFNPIAQGERFDSKGEFVRKWVPELQSVPDKYIHQPWKWTESDNLFYPKPMVDHKSEREITLCLFQDAKDFS